MYFNQHTVLFLNGEWQQVKDATSHLYLQSLHYGNGAFEGLRSYNTENGAVIFKAKEHFERLHQSCEQIHINLDYKVDKLIDLTYELLKKNKLTNAYIRPIVFMGTDMMLRVGSDVNIALLAWKWRGHYGYKQLKVKTTSFRKPNANTYLVNAKITGYYINSILAIEEAKKKGCDGAVWLNQEGYIMSGADGNFFFQKGNTLYTAPLGNVFPGITRKTVFELAKPLGIKIVEKYFRPEEVYGTEGAFFTGTDNEILGIKEYDNAKFTLNWEETLGYELAMAYWQLVRGKDPEGFGIF